MTASPTARLAVPFRLLLLAYAGGGMLGLAGGNGGGC